MDKEMQQFQEILMDAVLMSLEDFSAWEETACLLRSPANARRLSNAVATIKAAR